MPQQTPAPDSIAGSEPFAARRPVRYWRSLEELAGDSDGLRRLGDEFAPDADVWLDPVSRRNFIRIMGASLALAGVVGCNDFPEEKIVPYVNQPESVVPGRPTFYATTIPLNGFAMGALAESHEGRPTKIEGNPDHPASLGATNVFMQASVLDLYDPDRSKLITHGGIASTWGTFYEALRSRLDRIHFANFRITSVSPVPTSTNKSSDGGNSPTNQSESNELGEGVRLLTRTVTSPTFARQLSELKQRCPKLRWHVYEPTASAGCSGGVGGNGRRAVYDFSKADVILALDADFLSTDAGSLAYARQFADGRRRTPGIDAAHQTMNRLYVIESTLTLSGSMADHRRAVKPSEILSIARALAKKLRLASSADSDVPTGLATFIDAVAADLKRAGARAIVVAGDHQPAEVQVLAQAMNVSLGNVGQAVRYIDPPQVPGGESIAALVADMNGGRVNTLLILGGNPVYDAPADLAFGDAIKKLTLAADAAGKSANFTAHLSSHDDETSFCCQWHIPESHYLESWGDARAFDGLASVIQPLILPLSPASRSICEILEAMNGRPNISGFEAVRATWQESWDAAHSHPPQTQASEAARGKGARVQSDAGTFEQWWDLVLQKGVIDGTAFPLAGATSAHGETSPGQSIPAQPTTGQSIITQTTTTQAVAAQTETGHPITAQPVVEQPGPAHPATSQMNETPPATAQPAALLAVAGSLAATGTWQLLFRPDPAMWDGQFANNAWLAELPKPFTKLVWDNAAHISLASAKKLGIGDGGVVRVTIDGRTLEVPVVIVPGCAEQTLTLSLGYGRTRAGHIANETADAVRGFNAYLLRTSQNSGFAVGAKVEVIAGKTWPLVMTRSHHAMDESPGYDKPREDGRLSPSAIEHPGMSDEQIEIHNRRLVRSATLDEFRKDENWVTRLGGEGEMRAKGLSAEFPGRKIHLTLYPANAADGGWDYSTGHQWAMSIDQNTCIGCNACVIACQAENNIPVVGKDQCARQREMHWIRIDDWFGPSPGATGGDAIDDPQIVHMPVACQHCENAPCEVVCPVGATTHSVEGINEMTYNRCIGTRYCSNNCPYKVRRFNFLLYSDYEPTRALQYNPDVTVRSRGVMEKCNYCVQRLNRTRMDIEKLTVALEERAALIENQSPARAKALRDSLPKQQKELLDQLQTACQQACPTRAIAFGDKNAPGNAIAKLKEDKLDYTLLTNLTTQPRTSYLARLQNPNPAMS